MAEWQSEQKQRQVLGHLKGGQCRWHGDTSVAIRGSAIIKRNATGNRGASQREEEQALPFWWVETPTYCVPSYSFARGILCSLRFVFTSVRVK